ncbi:MAG: hypothetical protein IPM81_10550 [Saprospirales bacterium]|nr:hypothetical protein [Saprospirales bacterium]
MIPKWGAAATEQFTENITQIRVRGLNCLWEACLNKSVPGKSDVLFNVWCWRGYAICQQTSDSGLSSKYEYLEMDVQSIYKYMKNCRKQKEAVATHQFEHTMEVLGGEMSIVFYDLTTLYFEIERKRISCARRGFPKKGKHATSTDTLGAFGQRGCLPAENAEILKPNKFEGHTMLPSLRAFKQQLWFRQTGRHRGFLAVKQNWKNCCKAKGTEFILGARIKNETSARPATNSVPSAQNGEITAIEKPEGIRLVIGSLSGRGKKMQPISSAASKN